MKNFAKNTKLAEKLLRIMPVLILVLLIADAFFVSRFNGNVYTVQGTEQEAPLRFEARGGNGGAWVKRDFDLYGTAADLNARTYDGIIRNETKYRMKDWSFTLRIRGDCFVNSAWCGTMEIHQHAASGGEKVQTLDLRNYDLNQVTLDYLYDNVDLLIPLHAGDSIVYHPSEENNESPILKNS